MAKYDNNGQWKCFEKRVHPLTGEWYKVPSDHGSDQDMRDAKSFIAELQEQIESLQPDISLIRRNSKYYTHAVLK